MAVPANTIHHSVLVVRWFICRVRFDVAIQLRTKRKRQKASEAIAGDTAYIVSIERALIRNGNAAAQTNDSRMQLPFVAATLEIKSYIWNSQNTFCRNIRLCWTINATYGYQCSTHLLDTIALCTYSWAHSIMLQYRRQMRSSKKKANRHTHAKKYEKLSL